MHIRSMSVTITIVITVLGRVVFVTGVVEVERRGRVAKVVMNRPEVYNALDLELAVGLEDALRALSGEVNVVVLQGAEGNFCVGADLRHMAKIRTDPQAVRS